MSLYLFDFGKFQHFGHALDKKKIYQTSLVNGDQYSSDIQNNPESNSKDEETDDSVPPIKSSCQGHSHKATKSPRRMSVPQLSRNETVIKMREQRIASVVGIPHRHHITIAVNDEPVDIIKTTCTGPCLQSCQGHTKSSRKKPSSKSDAYQNGLFLDGDPRNKHNSTNIIILNLIYVISTICVRAILTLYTTMFGHTSFQRKLTISLVYFFAAISILGLSFNPSPGHLTSWSGRIRIILSLLLIILWSGVHLITALPLFVSLCVAAVLGVALSLFWDCQLQLLVRWSQVPYSQVESSNYVTVRSNIVPTTNVISHSMHIWSNILIFIVLEAMSTAMLFSKKLIKTDVMKNYPFNNSNLLRAENITEICGIIGEFSINQRWKKPDQIMYYLHYVCISLNIIAIILVVLLFDKSRSIRIPSNSLDKDACQSVLGSHNNQNSTLLPPNEASETFQGQIKNRIFFWAKSKSIILMKICGFQNVKFVLPSMLTMGLVEGFFITDYNEKFVKCFHKSSFIGISMLAFALGIVLFVNIFQIFKRQQFIGLVPFPVSRTVFLSSSLVLALTNAGHHWSYLLIFYPIVLSGDAIICMAVYYVNVANIPIPLADNCVAIHRFLRLLGVAIYVLLSALVGPLISSMMTVIAHCFISPAIILLARLSKDNKG